MNKFTKICFAGIFLFLLSGIVVSNVSAANEETSVTLDGITYSLTESGSGTYAKVTAISDVVTEVTIPAEVTNSNEKYTVNSIGDSVFKNNTKLTKITLNTGSSFTMASNQFAGCTQLAEVVIGEGLTEVSNNAFANCAALEKVTLPDTVTILGESSFQNCSKLTTINWPAGLKSIGTSAFQKCISLTELKLGTAVETLSSSAFRDCTGLTSITLPDSVVSLGVSVFQGCSKLSELTLGAKLTEIQGNAFTGTAITKLAIPAKVASLGITSIRDQGPFPSTLTELIVASDNATYSCENNMLVEKATDKIVYACSVSGEITLNKNIGPQAFFKQNLTKVTVASGVKSISGSAFAYCSKLTEVSLPSTLEDISYAAFGYCTSLKTLTLEDGITCVGGFNGCTALADVTLPNSVKTLGDHVFDGCSGLKTINLPEGLEVVGSYAFYNCKGLSNLSLPSSLKEIGDSGFRSSSIKFSGITLGAETEIKLGSYAINISGATSLTLNKVTCDSEYSYGKMFYNAKNCTITLGEDFKLWKWVNGLGISLDGKAVYLKDPSSTADVVIPKTVERIVGIGFQSYLNNSTEWKITCEDPNATITLDSGNVDNPGVFNTSKYLTSVSLPNVIVTEKNTFYNCIRLQNVTMTSISSIPEGTFSIANEKLQELIINKCDSITGALSLGTCGVKLISFPDTLKTVSTFSIGLSLYTVTGKPITFPMPGPGYLTEEERAAMLAGKTFLGTGNRTFNEVASDEIVIVKEASAGNSYQKVAKGTCIGLSGSGQIYRLAEGYVLLTTVVDGVNTYMAVEKGKTYPPENPVSSNKNLKLTWYTDADLTKEYDSTVALDADTVVYAKIETVSATVNLVEDGKILKSYENIAEGKTITLQTSETKGFEGWSINGLLLGAQYTVSLTDADTKGNITLNAKIAEEVKTTWNLTVSGTGIDGKVFCTASNLIGTYGMITVLPGEFEEFGYEIKSANAVVGEISDSCLMVSSKDGKDVEISIEFKDVGKAAEYTVSIAEITADGKSGFRATLTADDGGYIDTDGTLAIGYVYKVYNETEKAWVYTTSGSTEGVTDCTVEFKDKAVKTEVFSGDFTLDKTGAYLVYGYAKYSYKDASATSTTVTVTSPVIVSFVSTVQAVIGKS